MQITYDNVHKIMTNITWNFKAYWSEDIDLKKKF